MADEEKSYLQRRVFDEMGLLPEQQRIKLFFETGVDDRSESAVFDIFTSDKDDNIVITIYDLKRNLFQEIDEEWAKKGYTNYRYKTYQVIRLNPKNIPDGSSMKYKFPKGLGVHPFFPPLLVAKYENKETIDTLVLTEGYFKAMCASVKGVDIVGLSSITHYAESNGKAKRLPPDISKIIDVCDVQTVIILYDGDCLNISTKDLERQEELTRRPNTFLQALLSTRELLLDKVENIYFAHVLSDELKGHPKGLDDLLLAPEYAGKTAEIIEDLYNLKGGNYFHKMDIKSKISKLQRYFNLNSVQMFYTAWQDQIKNKQFVFWGTIYQYDEHEKKLNRIVPRALRNFIRVGDDYYEKILVPSVRDTNHHEVRLVPRLKGTIIDDFGRSALQYVEKYKAFINAPSHTNYKEIIDNCYNTYSPLTYSEEKGEWSHIHYMMEHIFGKESDPDSQFQLGMDYMQLLYQKPLQILPILCLVSSERGTGKTSFLDLLREIYGNNAIIVGNSEITSEFNALVSGKLIVGVDETSLDDNTKITERIKMMSTAKRIPMQRKGKDHEEIENFTKYILCSNNETRFIYTQANEVRFWVIKVPVIPKEHAVPDIMQYFHDEIPAFLYYLNQRKMFIKESKERMWFSAEDLETDALRQLKLAQRPVAVREIEETVRTLFLSFPAFEYRISVNILKEMVSGLRSVQNEQIRMYLREYLGVEDVVDENGVSKVTYMKIPYAIGEQVNYFTDKNRGFVFKAEKFLSVEHLEVIRKQLQPQFDESKDLKEPPQMKLPYKD